MKRTAFKRRINDLKPIGKPSLKKKAWNVFSKWIRNRDKRCVTCGSTNHLQAGHFWHNCLDFCEININAQCTQCNKWKSGNLAPYSVYLINKHGLETFQDLEKRHWLAMRGEYRSDKDYQDLIEKYTLSTVKRVIDY